MTSLNEDVSAYGDMAEFYELVAEQQAQRSGPLLREALAGLTAEGGTAVEIGSGTGRITEIIAETVTDADILAVEPAPGMRAVLTSRLAGPLGSRVTVSTDAAPDLALPEQIRAAVVFGVAGHLDASGRTRLWSRLRERLMPGGVVVVELMGVRSTRPLSEACQLRSRVGDLAYEWWVGGTPMDEGTMRFSSRWIVRDDRGRVTREVRGGYVWHAVGVEELVRESGMHVETLGARTGSGMPEVAVLHHPRKDVHV
ncbi:class I SAM-dependent methyltransferase [Kineosporia sp. NBRC 101731]|uniref:class I SAM-dependent methyltransferase n=1 Tax=Kineosporia sp. NBRC 101731 TaxID=3032199 RepID=UPI0024A1999A|nr:class I SAM-dependent methyltransferase [Kineosporia sp. NBRC 101731]GLY32365.1 methyltransferase type 12 [Kineosporia sp. NBRC 101731]